MWGQARGKNFDGGTNNNQLSKFKYMMPLVFKASSIKCAFFWHFFFWIILFRFKSANRKSAFIALRSLNFFWNVQISTLNESHHLLVTLSCQNVCENLDAISVRYAVCFFQPILQLSKESSWPSLWLRFLYLHVFDVHQHTFNRSRAATLRYDTDSQSGSTELARM